MLGLCLPDSLWFRSFFRRGSCFCRAVYTHVIFSMASAPAVPVVLNVLFFEEHTPVPLSEQDTMVLSAAARKTS